MIFSRDFSDEFQAEELKKKKREFLEIIKLFEKKIEGFMKNWAHLRNNFRVFKNFISSDKTKSKSLFLEFLLSKKSLDQNWNFPFKIIPGTNMKFAGMTFSYDQRIPFFLSMNSWMIILNTDLSKEKIQKVIYCWRKNFFHIEARKFI